jgi:ABC-2 type transport system permease protein
MMRGLLRLTWLEIKIFAREPLGFVGTVLVPVLMFLSLGRSIGPSAAHSPRGMQLLAQELPIFVSVFIAVNAALSLVAVISIYREGGILKRLRATPLRPLVILGAHVLVKLLYTGTSLALMVLAGRRFYPVTLEVHFAGFALAVLASTLAILSLGFVIASIVPTARFAQPIGSLILFPMLGVSGMFVPLTSLPRAWATLGNALPMAHAVALMRGAWAGASWLQMLPHLGVLALTIAISLALSSRVFRWE